MTRRAAAGLGRLLPLLLIAAAVIVVAGAALLAACGGSSGGTPTAQPTTTVTVTAPGSATASPSGSPSPSVSPAQTTLRVYFLRDEKLGVAERRVAQTTMPATAAVNAVLAGPTSAEKAAGLSTAVQPGLKLRSLTISGGVATVDLSKAPGTSSSDPAVAQLVYTLTRFPTVSSVRLKTDGTLWMDAETSAPATFSRADFRSLEPAIFVESPGVGALVRSPFVLTGTASVFEGTFQARLVDSSGRRIVNVTVQAGRGAPGRGRFSREIAFSTSATSGTLIVFDQSMEDGSRQDEVKIPVTFAAD